MGRRKSSLRLRRGGSVDFLPGVLLKNMNMTWPPLEPEVDPDEVRRRLA